MPSIRRADSGAAALLAAGLAALLACPLPAGLGGHASAAGVAGADAGPPAAARAGEGRRPQRAAGDGLTVRLLTFGPGARVWEKFGHNALWIRDPATGRDVVYNWGIFDFEQEDFLVRLLTGRMRYRVARSALRPALRAYRAAGRTIRVQELRLTPEQARRVARMARVHHRPENRHYAYDPFRDNCSTRIRDLLDRALDGAIRRQTSEVSTTATYRSHTRRLLQRVRWAYLGIMAFLGSGTDRRLSAWDEMFLPMRMAERLRRVEVTGPDGDPVALASAPRTLHLSDAPPPPSAVPGFHLGYLAAGLAGGTLLALLGLAGAGGRPRAAGAFTGLATAWSAAAGAAGVVAVGGWALTGHWYVHANENVLQLQPVSLALAVALPAAWALGSRRVRRWTLRLAWLTAGLALLGTAVQPLPGFHQVNGEILALTVPLHLGLASGLQLRLAGAGRLRPASPGWSGR